MSYLHMATTSSFTFGASQESVSPSRESLLVYLHPLPLVHRVTSGPGRKGRRRSRVSKLLPLVSKQTNNGGSVRPLNLYAEHCDAKYLVCHAETLRSERTHMCTLRIVDGDYLAGRLDAEKAELHQQPMKSGKPGWRGKRGRRGDLGFWKDFKRSCCSCPTSSENQKGEAH